MICVHVEREYCNILLVEDDIFNFRVQSSKYLFKHICVQRDLVEKSNTVLHLDLCL